MTRSRIAVLVGAFVALTSAGCPLPDPESSCSSDNDCKGSRVCNFGSCEEPSDMMVLKQCGATIVGCNCQSTTLVPGQITNNTVCDSHQGQASACAGSCGGLGVPWTLTCYCGSQSTDAGPVPDAATMSSCPTQSAGIRPLGPAGYFCGSAGPIVVSEMTSLNQFWSSGVTACVYGVDQPYVQGNAVSHGGTGYVYYDPQFLAMLDSVGMSLAPSNMVMAHEFGHEIQGWSSTGGQLSISRELGADCYAGYYLGWLSCRMQLSMQDVTAAFNAACNAGTNLPWWAPGNHGTCSMRVQALRTGMDAFANRVPPISACTL